MMRVGGRTYPTQRPVPGWSLSARTGPKPAQAGFAYCSRNFSCQATVGCGTGLAACTI